MTSDGDYLLEQRIYIRRLEGVMAEWRGRVYPCKAESCKCVTRWHFKSGIDGELVKRTDALIEEGV